jgi:hypothetical protein
MSNGTSSSSVTDQTTPPNTSSAELVERDAHESWSVVMACSSAPPSPPLTGISASQIEHQVRQEALLWQYSNTKPKIYCVVTDVSVHVSIYNSVGVDCSIRLIREVYGGSDDDDHDTNDY